MNDTTVFESLERSTLWVHAWGLPSKAVNIITNIDRLLAGLEESIEFDMLILATGKSIESFYQSRITENMIRLSDLRAYRVATLVKYWSNYYDLEYICIFSSDPGLHSYTPCKFCARLISPEGFELADYTICCRKQADKKGYQDLKEYQEWLELNTTPTPTR